MDFQMTTENNMGLVWEHRLVLWLPPPISFAALLIAVGLSAAYLGFQWIFGFGIETSAAGMGVFLVAALMVPVYLYEFLYLPSNQELGSKATRTREIAMRYRRPGHHLGQIIPLPNS